jgi:DNA-directed RNA polymerase subunit E'/Rpb7
MAILGFKGDAMSAQRICNKRPHNGLFSGLPAAPCSRFALRIIAAVCLQKELTKTVVIHPRFLGKQLRKTVTETLIAEVVGSCLDGAHVIAVLRISDENISHGTIEPLTGSVRYDVTYRAIMFRPFRNEVLDCVVKSVTPVRLAPFSLCLHAFFYSFTYLWIVVAAGFLCRGWPAEHLRVACGMCLHFSYASSHSRLVSGRFCSQNIPGDVNLRADTGAWVFASGEEIKADVDVRVKIMSASVQVTHLVRAFRVGYQRDVLYVHMLHSCCAGWHRLDSRAILGCVEKIMLV